MKNIDMLDLKGIELRGFSIVEKEGETISTGEIHLNGNVIGSWVDDFSGADINCTFKTQEEDFYNNLLEMREFLLLYNQYSLLNSNEASDEELIQAGLRFFIALNNVSLILKKDLNNLDFAIMYLTNLTLFMDFNVEELKEFFFEEQENAIFTVNANFNPFSDNYNKNLMFFIKIDEQGKEQVKVKFLMK